MNLKWLLLAVPVLAAAGSLTLLNGGDDQVASIRVPVVRRDFIVEVEAEGGLEAVNKKTLNCPFDGIEVEWLVPDGTLVREGDVVIKFNDVMLSHEHEQSRHELQIAEARREEAAAKLEAERARLLLDVEHARVEAAIARLDLAEVKSHPHEDESSIALMEYLQAQAVRRRAAQEYHRLVQPTAAAVLNSDELQKLESDLEKAESAYARAKLELELTRCGPTRYVVEKLETQIANKELHLNNCEKIMPDRLRQMESEVESVSTRVESVRIQWEKARDELGQAQLKAPADGLAVYRSIWDGKLAVGRRYYRGAQLMDIPDLTRMQLNGKIREDEIDLIALDQEVLATVDGLPGQVFHGKVKKIGKMAVDTSESEVMGVFDTKKKTGIKVFDVVVELEQSEALLLPRMRVRARIQVRRIEGALVIPKIALSEERGRWYVQSDSGGKIAVTPGPANDHQAVIESGLAEGDVVLLKP